MEIGTTFLIVALLIVAIWIVIEVKRLKHKVFAIALIALILFTYLSFSVVVKDQNINFKSPGGMIKGSKLYFSWIGSVFGNLKTITTHAVKMDWKGNESVPKDEGLMGYKITKTKEQN